MIKLKELMLLKVKRKEYMVQQYLFFIHGSKLRDSVCNGCHDLTMLFFNRSDVAIITVKDVYYCCLIHKISKSNAIQLLESSMLDNFRYI